MAEYLKFRRLMSLALVMSGAVLLAYGLFVHAAIISSAEDANTAALANRETVLIREVAIGGLDGRKKQVQHPYLKICPMEGMDSNRLSLGLARSTWRPLA